MKEVIFDYLNRKHPVFEFVDREGNYGIKYDVYHNNKYVGMIGCSGTYPSTSLYSEISNWFNLSRDDSEAIVVEWFESKLE